MASSSSSGAADVDFRCSFCTGTCVEPVVAGCGEHTYCKACLSTWIRGATAGGGVAKCPHAECRAVIQQDPAQLRVHRGMVAAIARVASLEAALAAARALASPSAASSVSSASSSAASPSGSGSPSAAAAPLPAGGLSSRPRRFKVLVSTVLVSKQPATAVLDLSVGTLACFRRRNRSGDQPPSKKRRVGDDDNEDECIIAVPLTGYTVTGTQQLAITNKAGREVCAIASDGESDIEREKLRQLLLFACLPSAVLKDAAPKLAQIEAALSKCRMQRGMSSWQQQAVDADTACDALIASTDPAARDILYEMFDDELARMSSILLIFRSRAEKDVQFRAKLTVKFSELFDAFHARIGACSGKYVFFFNDERLCPDDTPLDRDMEDSSWIRPHLCRS
jgi:hypothetical protein